MLSLLKHELFSRIWAILGWGAGLSAFAIMYIAIYPEAGEQMAAISDLSVYEAMGVDMSSFNGYIASTVVQFLAVLLAIYAIISSSATLAGEDDNGSLELMVSMPLKRWEIVSMKAAALAIVSFLILLIAAMASVLVFNAILDLITVEVSSAQLFIAILSGWPLVFAFLMMGLFFSALLPNRRSASWLTTIIFIISYFGESVTGYVMSLNAIKPFSLFYYFDSSPEVLSKGVQGEDVGILLGVAIVFFVLALISFEHRNITVGQWPWQRLTARQYR